MKYLFSWVLLFLVIALSFSLMSTNKNVGMLEKELDILKHRPTVINVPMMDGEEEIIKEYMAFGVLGVSGGELPVVFPVFISREVYDEQLDNARISIGEQYLLKTRKEKPHVEGNSTTGQAS